MPGFTPFQPAGSAPTKIHVSGAGSGSAWMHRICRSRIVMVKMRARPDGKPRDVVLRLRLGPIPVVGQVVYKYQ